MLNRYRENLKIFKKNIEWSQAWLLTRVFAAGYKIGIVDMEDIFEAFDQASIIRRIKLTELLIHLDYFAKDSIRVEDKLRTALNEDADDIANELTHALNQALSQEKRDLSSYQKALIQALRRLNKIYSLSLTETVLNHVALMLINTLVFPAPDGAKKPIRHLLFTKERLITKMSHNPDFSYLMTCINEQKELISALNNAGLKGLRAHTEKGYASWYGMRALQEYLKRNTNNMFVSQETEMVLAGIYKLLVSKPLPGDAPQPSLVKHGS